MQTTRDKILSATVGFLKDDSNYEQLTLSKIALAANIGKSTVYDYFKSKEELVEETSIYLLNYYDNIIFEDLISTTFTKAFHEQLSKLIFVVRDAKVINDAIFSHHSENLPVMKSKKIEAQILLLQEKLNTRFQEIFQLAYNENLITNTNQDKYNKYVISSIISGLIDQYENKTMEIEESELIKLIEKHCINVLNYRSFCE